MVEHQKHNSLLNYIKINSLLRELVLWTVVNTNPKSWDEALLTYTTVYFCYESNKSVIFPTKNLLWILVVKRLHAFNLGKKVSRMSVRTKQGRGQFHQPSGAKCKRAGSHSSAPFSFTNEITPNFTNYKQLVQH